MLNHVLVLVMSSHVVSVPGEVHEAHRASGDQGGEEAAQIPLPLPGDPSSHCHIFSQHCHAGPHVSR